MHIWQGCAGELTLRAVEEHDGELLAALVHWLDGGRLEYLKPHAWTGDPTVQPSDEELIIPVDFPVLLDAGVDVFGGEISTERPLGQEDALRANPL